MKYTSFGSLASALIISFVGTARGVCPACTIAVCGGVEFSRWLGVDDAITGVWVGGLIVSLIMWAIAWLGRSGLLTVTLVSSALYTAILVPLYWFGMIGREAQTLCGVDRLLFGIIIGSLAFTLGAGLHATFKSRFNRSFFPFQKVVIPLVMLIGVSFLIQLILRMPHHG